LSQFTKERDGGDVGMAHTKMLLESAKKTIYSKHVAGLNMVEKDVRNELMVLVVL